MRKIMRKVKSQWIAVGLSALAMVGSGIGITAAEATTVASETTSTVENARSGRADLTDSWVAYNVDEIEAEIDQQQDSHREDYEIQWGDTLWGISQATGIPISQLALMNNVSNPDLIYSGSTLGGIVSGYRVAVKNRVSVDPLNSYEKVAPYKYENESRDEKENDKEKIVNKGTEVIIAKPVVNESPTKHPVASNSEVAAVKKTTIKEAVTTPFETVYVEDATLNIGEKIVTQVGVDGLKTNTYTVTFIKGIEKKRKLSNTEITTEPINQVIAVGTKEMPIVTTKTEQSTEAIPYETATQEDASLLVGETKVIQPGVDGSKTNTYNVTLTDGVETNRELSNTEITIAPVNEIVAIGTKVVETKVETATENIVAFETITQEDNTIPIGETQIVQAGTEGYDTVTYEVTYANGIEMKRAETSRNTTSPVEEIITVGTKAGNIELKSDTEAPEVLHVSVEQGIMLPGDSVTVTAEIADEKSGVEYAYAYFTAPSGNKSEVVTLKRISGNTFEGEFIISEYEESGTWNLDYIFVRDNENNSRVLYESDLATITENTSTSIIVGDANSDTEAPEVLHVSVEQGIMLPGDSVTVTAEIADEKSGVEYAYAYFTAPSGNKSEVVTLKRISGNTFEGEFIISEYEESGTWNLDYIFVRDNENNSRVLYESDLATITENTSTSIIVGDANSDTEAPEVLHVSVEQGAMLPGDSVTVTAEITDDKSGIEYAYAYFTAPSGNKSE
ncbi:G5 domain-containing protein, partial [Trichococcus alkaliphilus]|uniref:G5 domain-containing protein n=1 Tax=Trichococcus alkaliphilus TaxID=2052943 RepID=UPI001374B012